MNSSLEICKITEQTGCIRGISEISEGILIIYSVTRLSLEENDFHVEFIKESFGCSETLADRKVQQIKVLGTKDSLHDILVFEKSSKFVLVFTSHIAVRVFEPFEILVELSNPIDNVESPSDRFAGKTMKERRYRRSLKNPILLNDRHVVLVAKKKRFICHDIRDKKTRLLHPKSASSSISSNIVRIRRISDKRHSRFAATLETKLDENDTVIRVYQINEGLVLESLRELRFPFNKPRMFLGFHETGSILGISKNCFSYWKGSDFSHTCESHSFPIRRVFGSELSPDGKKMVCITEADFENENRVREEVEKLELPINVGHINCYFVTLIDYEEKEIMYIGRIAPTRSSRGYPILFLDNNFVVFLSQEIKDLTRKPGKKTTINIDRVEWKEHHEERKMLFSIFDIRGKKYIVKEKVITISASNGCPALYYIPKKSVLFVSNKAYKIPLLKGK